MTISAGCRFGFDSGDPDGGGSVDAGDGAHTADGPGEAGQLVYVHSPTELYSVDPATFGLRRVGTFGGPCTTDTMTDVAIDRSGQLLGVSFMQLYRIDPVTADCELLAPLPRQFNGLTFTESATDPTVDILIGTTLTGEVWEIDPGGGAGTRLGRYGGGIESAGDVVFVHGLGAFAAARRSSDTTDWIARVDLTNGDATLIGDTGLPDVFGIAYWGGSLYGFTDSGTFVLIDPATGAATVKNTGLIRWWGAGVTTLAEVAAP